MSILLNGLIVAMAVYEVWYKKINWKNEKRIVFLAIALIVLLFEYKVGILNCGYHFVDDHEIFTINAKFEKYGIINTFIKSILSDFQIRYRPTYTFIRVFEAFCCGTNLFAWHMFNMLLTILTLYYSYVFARVMQCSPCFSLIFVLVCFVGVQSAALWRLGPQEGLGMLLLMLTLLCLCEYADKGKIKYMWKSIVLTVLLGGIKESFLLILPILPGFLIFMDIRNENPDFSVSDLCKTIKKRRGYILATLADMSLGMGMIVFQIGILPIGYAGIDASMGVKEYAVSMINICLGEGNWYCLIMCMAVILIIVPLAGYVLINMRQGIKIYFLNLSGYIPRSSAA